MKSQHTKSLLNEFVPIFGKNHNACLCVKCYFLFDYLVLFFFLLSFNLLFLIFLLTVKQCLRACLLQSLAHVTITCIVIKPIIGAIKTKKKTFAMKLGP